MGEANVTTAAPWTPPASASTVAPKPPLRDRMLPFIGPVVLFIVWDLVVRLGFIKPILLPTPADTIAALITGLAGGPLLTDFAMTVWRTVQAFVIPLFLLIFGVSDVNKVAIAAFGALLIVVFNSAYGVINARKQRVMAARVMGASRWQIFKDVLVWESLQPSFVGLRSAVSMALVIVIVAEMFIGSDTGLGHRIIDAQQVLNVKSMYAAILAAGALGYALNILFLIAERRIVHWSGR